MYTHTTHIRVRYAETDQMGVVYHGNYAQFFEVGRVEAIRALGMSYKELEDMQILMPVIEFTCKYLRPALYDDLLTVKTFIKQLPTDHKIEFFNEIYNEQGKLLTTGKVLLYFIKSGTKEKTIMPDAMHNQLKPYFINQDI